MSCRLNMTLCNKKKPTTAEVHLNFIKSLKPLFSSQSTWCLVRETHFLHLLVLWSHCKSPGPRWRLCLATEQMRTTMMTRATIATALRQSNLCVVLGPVLIDGVTLKWHHKGRWDVAWGHGTDTVVPGRADPQVSRWHKAKAAICVRARVRVCVHKSAFLLHTASRPWSEVADVVVNTETHSSKFLLSLLWGCGGTQVLLANCQSHQYRFFLLILQL